MAECTTTLCCVVCDGDDHVTKACPLAKGVKPTAIPCGYAVEGLGFYYIPYTEKQKTKTESREAVVTISEGSLTAAQVAVELERLLPGIKWNWVLEEIGEKSFATIFPSEAELQRMVLWGPVVARCANAKMEIKEKKDTEVWKYEIPKVWIQFRGITNVIYLRLIIMRTWQTFYLQALAAERLILLSV